MSRHLFAAALTLFLATTASALDGVWSGAFHASGPDREVLCLIEDGGDVLAAGRFDAVGTVATPAHVARWHAGQWSPVGAAITAYSVYDLCRHEGVLHALGSVDGGCRVWRLMDGQWETVGDVLPGSPGALATYQGDLHAGPYRLEEGAWVDRLQTDGPVQSLVEFEGLLVAGGRFTSAGGVATGRVAAWDGTTVVTDLAGQDSVVADLAVWHDQLFAARDANGPDEAVGVQVWTGTAWSDVAELGTVHPFRRMTDLVAGPDRLLVCGYSYVPIIKVRDLGGAFLRAWDGEVATPLYEPEDAVRFLAALDTEDGALVGGIFTTLGDPLCSHLGRVAGGAISPVCEPGLGADGAVSVLRDGLDGLALGGDFRTVGGMVSQGVMLHDAGAWVPRDLRVVDWQAFPADLVWDGPVLGAVVSRHVGTSSGYWDGTQWVFGESNFGPDSRALVAWNGRVLGAAYGAILEYPEYVQAFPYAEVDGECRCLLAWNGDLVAAGDFTAVDGVPAAHIAVHDGAAWQPLGTGLPESVEALGLWQGQLVVASRGPGEDWYTAVIRVWTGADWNELGVLTGGPAEAVQEYAGCLFVAGAFDCPDDAGRPMTGLACWDGAHWQSVGAARHARALAVRDGRLWVGGAFRLAGGVPASYLTTFTATTTATPDPIPTASALALVAPAPNPFNPRTELRFALPCPAHVRLTVHDVAGRRLRTVLDGFRPAGEHRVVWDGTDAGGRALPSGTYLIRLEAGGRATSATATLVR